MLLTNVSNFAEHQNIENVPFLLCTRHWEENGQVTYFFIWYHAFVALFAFLSLVATSSNILILIALHKDASLHPPSKFLLRSLTFTDLCVGIIGLPIAIVFLMSAINEHWELCRFTKDALYVSSTTLSGVSLATLTGISVDRFLALVLRLRYRQVVTLKRVRVAVILFWIKSFAVGLVYIWSLQTFFIVGAVLISLEIAIPGYSYTKIFLTIHNQQAQVHAQPSSVLTAPNMAKYKKTVTSALWVHLTLATCYLPFAVVLTLNAVRGRSQDVFLSEGFAVSLVYINSSLNPALYCWKIKEVRRAVKETLAELCSCPSN